MTSLEELSLNLKNNEIGDDNVNMIWEVLNNLNNLTSLIWYLSDNNINGEWIELDLNNLIELELNLENNYIDNVGFEWML